MLSGLPLKNYIRSKGTILPSLEGKLSGQAHDYMCAFCDNPHGGQPLIRYAVKGSSLGATFTGAFLCWDCQEEVARLEETVSGPPPKSTLFDGIADTTVDRIELYSVHQKFDPTVDFHLNWREEPSSHTCYFCKGAAVDNYVDIPVPVRITPDDVNGGKVRMCISCRLAAETLFSDPVGYTHQVSYLDRCVKCQDSYLIDMDELEYRKSAPGTMDLHMCPDCVADELMREKSIVVYATDNPLKRFLDHECAYCKEPFLIDVTILREVLHKWHYSSQNKVMCEDCYDGSVGGPVHVFRISGSHFYRLFKKKLDREEKFVVVETKDGKRITTVIDTDITDFIITLHESATKHLLF